MQFGHAGAKASTRVSWEGIDQPLPDGNWPIVSASPQQYLRRHQPVVARRDARGAARHRSAIRARHAKWPTKPASTGSSCTARTATCSRASSRRSPTSARTNTAARSRTACAIRCEVFDAMRAVWPDGQAAFPCAFRRTTGSTAAHTPDDAVADRARLQGGGRRHDRRLVRPSQQAEKPVYGRMFQTPFSDRIRNETGIATIAVGAIFEADHVNSIIAAGRADLCAVARPHLANPAWTLNGSREDRLLRPRVAEAIRRRQIATRTQPRTRTRGTFAGNGRGGAMNTTATRIRSTTSTPSSRAAVAVSARPSRRRSSMPAHASR